MMTASPFLWRPGSFLTPAAHSRVSLRFLASHAVCSSPLYCPHDATVMPPSTTLQSTKYTMVSFTKRNGVYTTLAVVYAVKRHYCYRVVQLDKKFSKVPWGSLVCRYLCTP